MSVPNNYDIIVVTGTDAEIRVDIPWEYDNISELYVWQQDDVSGLVYYFNLGDFTVVENSDQTGKYILVEKVTEAGGEVTINTARETPKTQTYDLANSQPLDPVALIEALDKAIKLIQETSVEFSPDNQIITSVNPFIIPDKVERAGKILAFDDNGDVNVTTSDEALDKAIGYAEEWAINPEDDPVSTSAGGDGVTTFSSLHWSAKSEGFSNESEASRDKAEKWADEDENVPVEAGQFSAKHWAKKAEEDGGGIGAYTLISTGQLLEVNKGYMYESTTTETHLLPVSPAEGDLVRLSHTEVGTSIITVDGNGNDILQYPNTTDTSISLDIIGAYIEITYNGTEWFVSDFSGTIGENSDLVPRNSIALIEDQKPSETTGGSSLNNAWQKRDLNTLVSDTGSIVSALVNNEFTLIAGVYIIEATCPNHRTGSATIALYNNGVLYKEGSQGYARSESASASSAKSHVQAEFTSTGTESLSIYNFTPSSFVNTGLGLPSTPSGSTEIYTQVKITKLGA